MPLKQYKLSRTFHGKSQVDSVNAFNDVDAVELFCLKDIQAYGRQVEVINHLTGQRTTKTLSFK